MKYDNMVRKEEMKTIKITTQLSLFFILIFSDTGLSIACDCAEPEPIAVEYEKADVVFIGNVMETVIWDWTKIKPIEVFKGDFHYDYKIVATSDCSYVFEKNKDYLVYADYHDGQMEVTYCGLTKEVVKAEEDIRILRNINNVNIPGNLEECFPALLDDLTDEQLREFKNSNEDELAKYHHSLGRTIRNNWGLWSMSGLKDYFNNMSIHHPDDMSSIILTSFHRHLHQKDIQLEEQLKYFQEFWEKTKERINE